MKKYCIIFLILAFIGTTPLSTFGACSIDNTPSLGMQEYLKNVKKVLDNLSSITTSSQCPTGATGQAKRALSRMDASFNEGFTMTDILVDFRYNFALLGRGEMRPPVLREGLALKKIENDITNRLLTMGSKCALDITVDSTRLYQGLTITRPLAGGTVENIFDALIQNNKNIESFYKQISVGDNVSETQFRLVSDGFAQDLKNSYNPEAAGTCGPQNGENSWEQVIKKGMRLIEFRGKSTESGLQSWRDALKLLDNNKNEIKDISLARRLLKNYLQTQGVGGSAVSITFFSLDAFDANTGNSTKDSEADKRLNQRTNNINRNFSDRVDTFFGSIIPKSKTTDEWVRKVNNINIQKIQAFPLLEEYKVAKSLLGDEAATDMKIMTDLTDLHIKLSQINENLLPAIKKAIKACEKQLPGVGKCSGYD